MNPKKGEIKQKPVLAVYGPKEVLYLRARGNVRVGNTEPKIESRSGFL